MLLARPSSLRMQSTASRMHARGPRPARPLAANLLPAAAACSLPLCVATAHWLEIHQMCRFAPSFIFFSIFYIFITIKNVIVL